MRLRQKRVPVGSKGRRSPTGGSLSFHSVRERKQFPLFVIIPSSTVRPYSFDSLAKYPQLRREAGQLRHRWKGRDGQAGPGEASERAGKCPTSVNDVSGRETCPQTGTPSGWEEECPVQKRVRCYWEGAREKAHTSPHGKCLPA